MGMGISLSSCWRPPLRGLDASLLHSAPGAGVKKAGPGNEDGEAGYKRPLRSFFGDPSGVEKRSCARAALCEECIHSRPMAGPKSEAGNQMPDRDVSHAVCWPARPLRLDGRGRAWLTGK